MAEQFVVNAEQGGQKLDRLVAQGAGVSRRIARLWIAAGRVRVNRRVMKILTRPVSAGATIEVMPQEVAAPPPAEYPLVEILYLDRWMVAVNKPPRLLSEHDRFNSPSLESVVPKLLEARGEPSRLWLVHRLDAGTSGVIVMARTPGAAAALSDAFRSKRAQKTYHALCQGVMRRGRLIDQPLQRALRTRQEVHPQGKPAQTLVEPLVRGAAACLVQATPRTGRTHQIRVHLAHLGYPLLGDRLYGGPGFTAQTPPEPIGRAMLHALQLSLPHPKEARDITVKALPPADFRDVAAVFGIEYVWR